jgi:hypothetical protein
MFLSGVHDPERKVTVSPGFPLKTCGNDGPRKENERANRGELDSQWLKNVPNEQNGSAALTPKTDAFGQVSCACQRSSTARLNSGEKAFTGGNCSFHAYGRHPSMMIRSLV